MDLLKKFIVDGEFRYQDVISIEEISEIAAHLYNPYKKRKNKNIQSEWQITGKEKRDGRIILKSEDKEGAYFIYQPTDHEYDKIESFAFIKRQLEILHLIRNSQSKLRNVGLHFNEMVQIKKEIDSLLLEINSVEETSNKELPFYCRVGALFAQNLLRKESFDFYYEEQKFDDVSKLANYIQKEVLNDVKSVRQYIDDTLKEVDGRKNFYKSLKMMDNIFKYCTQRNIQMHPTFIKKFNAIKNLH